jgi:hypothetical protein
LPGISLDRIVRAASAIAKSSAKASIREDLHRRIGLDFVLVTTGPALKRVTRAGMLKLASFATMIRQLSS